MKLIIKIEIVLLVVALLVGAGMILKSEGVVDLLEDPVIVEPEIPPIPTDAPVEAAEEKLPPEMPEKEYSERQISATKYFAYDIRKEEYLTLHGQKDAKLYPASITKLLTTYTILQHMDPQTQVTVGDALNLVQPDSSLAFLNEGDTLTVEQLVAAMLLPSGNDAAQVAAVAAGRTIAGDSSLPYEQAVALFVEQMNQQAKALGMTGSHFANPDGFHHDDHYTTMEDLVTLCKVVLTDPVIQKYVGTLTQTVTLPDRTLEWKNTNVLLDSETESYLANAIGMKTGYTSKAGSCLTSAFFMEDRIILIGVFGCPAFTDDRYLDTLAIYQNI